MFAAGKTATVSGAAPDDKFNYVTMLLHGDGTNGAQNNTFLDSSTNNFTITRNGNTTQGSFSPYGSNWSNYFDGSGDYLTVPDNTALDMGSSDFTLECWLYSTVGTSNECVINKGYNNSPSYLIFLDANTAGFFASSNGSTFDICSNSSIGSVPKNTWTHLAVCRSGSSIRLFNNGALITTVTSSASFFNSADNLIIGSTVAGSFYYNGYISNVRLVKGTALYTSAFTPSTTPLTAITNTSLLTCQSNRFIDNSTNAFAITVNGDTSVQRFNPFGASTAYSTSVIGGSGYFDGTGDYLQIADSSAFTFGSGDFTVEFWIYSSNTSLAIIIGQNNGTETATSFDVRYNGTTISGNIFSSATNYAISESMSKNAWHHVAFVRNGTSLRIYVDGVSTSSTAVSTVSVNDSSNVLRIGVSSEATPAYYLNGYLSNVRIVKGTAVYTSNFTPSTTPLTAITNTSLLTNFTNGAIYDNAMMNNLETVGNAQISTSVKKYGTGSLAFDGTGDYLLGPSTPNMSFGSGDFTVEAWVYRTASSANNQTIFQKGRTADSNLEFAMSLNSSNQLTCFYTTDGTTNYQPVASSTTVSLSTWTHVAITRSGSTWRCFVNGTLEATATASVTLYTGTGVISSGANPIGDNTLTGYMDDIRITKGYARYTATFTPPTSALSDTGPY